jgi:hypothetical protein
MNKVIPTDKNGKPLKDAFLVEVELNGVGPSRLAQATIEVAGAEKSTIKTIGGEYYVVDNSKIEIVSLK